MMSAYVKGIEFKGNYCNALAAMYGIGQPVKERDIHSVERFEELLQKARIPYVVEGVKPKRIVQLNTERP